MGVSGTGADNLEGQDLKNVSATAGGISLRHIFSDERAITT
jgi:hypothetical protein